MSHLVAGALIGTRRKCIPFGETTPGRSWIPFKGTQNQWNYLCFGDTSFSGVHCCPGHFQGKGGNHEAKAKKLSKFKIDEGR